MFEHKISLGQNFLINQAVLDRCVASSNLSESDVVLEVGPGQGVLTRRLLESPARAVHALEIDKRLTPWLQPLKDEFGGKFTLAWGNALHCPLAALSPLPNKVIANIPYNITTDLIKKCIIELGPMGLETMVLLVQKEAAERLMSPPGTRTRYPLGITLEAMGTSEVVMNVSPGSFNPPPRVWSSLIALHLTKNRNLAADKNWWQMLNNAFLQRRKKLLNNLSRLFDKKTLAEILVSLGIKETVRAEELTCAQWISLYKALYRKG